MMVIALVLFIGTLSQYGYVGQKVLVITLFSNEMDNKETILGNFRNNLLNQPK